jgi:hypothetical protein
LLLALDGPTPDPEYRTGYCLYFLIYQYDLFICRALAKVLESLREVLKKVLGS